MTGNGLLESSELSFLEEKSNILKNIEAIDTSILNLTEKIEKLKYDIENHASTKELEKFKCELLLINDIEAKMDFLSLEEKMKLFDIRINNQKNKLGLEIKINKCVETLDCLTTDLKNSEFNLSVKNGFRNQESERFTNVIKKNYKYYKNEKYHQ